MKKEYIFSDKEIRAAIKKYAGYYEKFQGKGLVLRDIKSEIGLAITKALRGWEKLADQTCEFPTYLDRVIKNSMRDFLRKEAVYCHKMVFSNAVEETVMAELSQEAAGVDVLSAFSGMEYHIASEFISPGQQVLDIIKAIKAKFKGYGGDLGDEQRLLKAGADCFAISLVYDVAIWQAVRVKNKIYEMLTDGAKK